MIDCGITDFENKTLSRMIRETKIYTTTIIHQKLSLNFNQKSFFECNNLLLLFNLKYKLKKKILTEY